MPKKEYIVISTKTTPTKSDMSLPPTQSQYQFRVEIKPKPLVFGQTISSVTKSDMTSPEKSIEMVSPEKKPFGEAIDKDDEMEINQVLKDIEKSQNEIMTNEA